LVPGGIWVNLGPLLYHFWDDNEQGSIEPSYEDLMIIIEAVGFEVLKNETGLRTQYCQNLRSMQKSEYESLFFVCRKPLVPKQDESDPSSDDEPDDLDEEPSSSTGSDDDSPNSTQIQVNSSVNSSLSCEN
jgi:carnosine N-methyltransferase